MPYQREAEIVLAMWRDIQRDMDSTANGSPEWERLQGESWRLRAEHKRLTDLAREHRRPLPPPLPSE